jgi:hypothetical protein
VNNISTAFFVRPSNKPAVGDVKGIGPEKLRTEEKRVSGCQKVFQFAKHFSLSRGNFPETER